MPILSSTILLQAKHWMKVSVNLLLPARCPGCGDYAGVHHRLCGSCWKKLTFITAPFCDRCGDPFVVDQSAPICGNCLHIPPLFTKGRAAFRYDSLIRELILQFKHGDATWLAKPLASWLALNGQDLLMASDVIMPVPLHRWRLFARRYNQATLLARELSHRTQIPLFTNVLVRHKRTESQHGKSRQERQVNVRAVFHIASKKRSLVKGKAILLIDDVWTTGATLNACVKTLKSAGAKDVFVLTLARVTKER